MRCETQTFELERCAGPALLVDVPRDKNITGKTERHNIPAYTFEYYYRKYYTASRYFVVKLAH
jgi:hypothetical protein